MDKLTILAVDDDKDILVLIEHLLKQKNYIIVKAESGVKAIDILNKMKPDIILLDVMMPGMSGYEVCLRIQEQEDLSLIPVIFLTALSSETDKARAFSLGAVDFISKPIDKNLLYSVIKKHAATENKWRRFLHLKREIRHHEINKEKSHRNQSIQSYRKFLFDFLKISISERDKLNSLNAIELAKALQDSKRLDQTRFAILMAQFVGLDYLPSIDADSILLDILPPKFSRHNNVIAIKFEEGYAFVIIDPFNLDLLNTLESLKPNKLFVVPVDAISVVGRTDSEINRELDSLESDVKSLYSGNEIMDAAGTPLESDEVSAYNLKVNLNASPLVQFVNKILETAYTMHASDIHIEPMEHKIVIRYRIDGELTVIRKLQPRRLINVIASRIKIMGKMDISERRLPQDGRFAFKEFTREAMDFDVRVSIAPLNYGEKIVMRILDKKKTLLPLESLGFSPGNLAAYRQQLRSPYGMILHVGPTGSGKSMSLYSALNEINHPNINIQTAEDPIEYTLEGISQMQVNPAIGLTFKEALRCFLRQDPDTILVGEIRDRETAEMAVEAALTGHLLFSTLHANDAPSTVVRLIEMGIAPYMISSSLVLVCGQRLVRRLCPECRQPYHPDETEKKLAGVTPGAAVTFYRPHGCPACNSTGYKGRIGIYEVLVPNDVFRAAMVSENVSTEQIRNVAVDHCGMSTLFQDAMEKVRDGVTSMMEAVSKVKNVK